LTALDLPAGLALSLAAASLAGRLDFFLTDASVSAAGGAAFKEASFLEEVLLAGVLDLEGTDEGSFFAAGEGEVLLEAVARSGDFEEMTPLGLFSSAWGLAVLLFNALAAGWLAWVAALAVPEG
jgi:hypothetical protein